MKPPDESFSSGVALGTVGVQGVASAVTFSGVGLTGTGKGVLGAAWHPPSKLSDTRKVPGDSLQKVPGKVTPDPSYP